MEVKDMMERHESETMTEQTVRVEVKESMRTESGEQEKEQDQTDMTMAEKDEGNGFDGGQKDLRFWLITLTLSITMALAALDGTIVVTTLPAITAEMGGGSNFIWVMGVFALAGVALQPLYGQFANFFGRRNLLCVSIAFFVLGSGICGGSKNMNMLIGGRLVQGAGAAGISLLVELIVCDLVPLRERGQYTAIVMSMALIGSTLGPWVGGELIAKSSWRWVFYINLPIGGTALVMVMLLLRVNTRNVKTRDLIRHIDILGDSLFAASAVAIMFGLINGGVVYAWGSWRILVPLILGIVGFVGFCGWEASPWCLEPALPKQLVGNRTSVAALIATFVHMSLLQWITYFISVYYQVAKHATPARAGVLLLPNVFGFLVGSVITGSLVTKTGRYRPWKWAGWVIATAMVGSFLALKHSTSILKLEMQIFWGSVGFGIVMPCLLPALQAELTDDDSAAAMAAMTIARAFGTVCGTLISSIVFNNEFDKHAGRIQDESVRNTLMGGQAYSHASKDFIAGLHGDTKDQVIETYLEALKFVWYVALAFCVVGFLLVFMEKEVALRTTLDTDFGLKEKKKTNGSAESGDGLTEPGLSA